MDSSLWTSIQPLCLQIIISGCDTFRSRLPLRAVGWRFPQATFTRKKKEKEPKQLPDYSIPHVQKDCIYLASGLREQCKKEILLLMRSEVFKKIATKWAASRLLLAEMLQLKTKTWTPQWRPFVQDTVLFAKVRICLRQYNHSLTVVFSFWIKMVSMSGASSSNYPLILYIGRCHYKNGQL